MEISAPSHTQRRAKCINLSCLISFNSNLLMFQLLGFCCKIPIYPGSSLSFWSSSSELRGCLLDLKFSESPPIEHNFQLLGCDFFFFSVENLIDQMDLFQWRAISFHSPIKFPSLYSSPVMFFLIYPFYIFDVTNYLFML